MAAAQTGKPDMAADDHLQEELAFANRGGCCSWFPCFGSRPSDIVWERIASTPEEEETTSWTREWLGKGMKTFKKIREWSELVAGPKWKTFIRRFNKSRGFKSGGKYNYDPSSYALNFDDGPGQNGLIVEDDDRIFRDFSSRYASIPITVKSNVESGKGPASLT